MHIISTKCFVFSTVTTLYDSSVDLSHGTSAFFWVFFLLPKMGNSLSDLMGGQQPWEGAGWTPVPWLHWLSGPEAGSALTPPTPGIYDRE